MNGDNSITYKEISRLEEVAEVVSLQSHIWSQDSVTPLAQLVASIKNGGVIIGSFEKNQLIGFCYGFAGVKEGNFYLVSHMAAVKSEYQNLGVGFQLKVKQREWALAYGYQKMVWTYDPLEVRNGFFNLCKLGAYSKQYLPSYYGEMNDKLNRGLPSDRLLIEWDLSSKRVERAINGVNRLKKVNYQTWLNWEEHGGVPVPVERDVILNQKGFLVSSPLNIQELKKSAPDVAKEWRFSLRKVMTEALSKGYIVTGIQKRPESFVHYYILEQKTMGDMND
ncbi:GNAT family N-acetyltransferase [Bacillus massilinigeriensis]|uniref:GNAT family N-acetyltransferase n=1 Tax=Bacillus massilionigeriensis TaxID=1805475 RepID=UPI00096B3F59|nr:GNAT family N-acetyltransferase [Bacillus massilionigeriensis]